MSCITPLCYKYDPNDPNQSNLATTMRLRKDDLVWEVVCAFMCNYKELCLSLTMLLNGTNIDKLHSAIYSLPIPAPTGQVELTNAVENLYRRCDGNREELDAVRGVVFESIAFELVYHRYKNVGDVCEHNVRVGIEGTYGPLVTSATVDIAAWDTTAHNSEFHECKLQLFNIEAKHLSAINTACRYFLTSEQPHSSLAILCTLTDEEVIEDLRSEPLVQGGKQEIVAPYPNVQFFNLSKIIDMIEES